MSKKVVRLTESQLRLMINKVIKEQTVSSTQNDESTIPFTVDFENSFASGQYILTPKYMNIVNDNVNKISDYIKDKNLKNFKLLITPGESQVPNPKGFEKKGSLATERANVLKKYLETVLPPLLNMKPKIDIASPVIGKTEWDVNLGKDNSIYEKEQFVKVSVVLTTNIIPIPKDTPYKITAKDSESIYFLTQYSNYLGAFAEYPTRQSSNIKDAGNLNTGIQDVTLKIIKKDVVPFQVTDVYKIPFDWWNNRTAAETNNLYPQDLDYIRKNFKRLS